MLSRRARPLAPRAPLAAQHAIPARISNLAAPNKCLALSNKSCARGEATKKRESGRRKMTKEEHVVGLIFQVAMWVYIAAAAAYVVIG